MKRPPGRFSSSLFLAASGTPEVGGRGRVEWWCQPSRVITKQTASPLVIRGVGQLCTGAAVKYNLSLIYLLPPPPHLEK